MRKYVARRLFISRERSAQKIVRAQLKYSQCHMASASAKLPRRVLPQALSSSWISVKKTSYGQSWPSAMADRERAATEAILGCWPVLLAYDSGRARVLLTWKHRYQRTSQLLDVSL